MEAPDKVYIYRGREKWHLTDDANDAEYGYIRADLHAEAVKELDRFKEMYALEGRKALVSQEENSTLRAQLAAAEERERGLREALILAANRLHRLVLEVKGTEQIEVRDWYEEARAAIAAHPREATAVDEMPPVREVGKDSGGAVYAQYVTDAPVAPEVGGEWEEFVPSPNNPVRELDEVRSTGGTWWELSDAWIGWKEPTPHYVFRRPLTSKKPHDTIP